MNLFYQPHLPDGVLYLDADESRHCVKVLRHKPGDAIRITDGKGYFYTARIVQAGERQCTFLVESKIHEASRPYTIHIAISPTKNADRMEWFVEKAVELGIDEITLVECTHTERTYQKTERLEKVAISAMKQSLKARVPSIHGLTPFHHIVTTNTANARYIAYVDSGNPLHLARAAGRDGHYLVLIGPEGDFDDDELNLALQHGFHKVSLGPSRLRTETAGLAACHILNLANER